MIKITNDPRHPRDDDDGSYGPAYGTNSKRKMPKQKPGNSRQDYGTPQIFIKAVEARFGKLDLDLAGTEANKKAPKVITPEEDSLAEATIWPLEKLMFLNPPFASIDPWAAKCAAWAKRLAPALTITRLVTKARSRIFFLTPMGAPNWFRDHVYEKAYVIALNGRLTFEGESAPYPKDCFLSCYGMNPGFELWNWKA